MLGLEKRERMFADSKVPIRMINPCDIEIILKPKLQIQIRPMTQLIENDAIIDPLNSDFAPVAIVEQPAAALFNFGHANGSNAEELFGSGKIHASFLFFRIDVDQHHALYR